MPKARQEPFPGICRSALLDEVEPLLDALRQKVLWREGLGGWECMALQSIYPLAYLYRTRFRGNAHCGSGEMLAAATEVGDFLCACILPERSAGYAATSHMLLATRDWAILFWLDAYALLRPSLPAGRRRRWEAAIAAVLRGYERRLRGFMEQGTFNSGSFRTSPNHAISYATDLLVGGVVLKSPSWRRLAEDFADRFVQGQAGAGYWAEGRGPVGGYQSVSMAGVARFNALRPKPAYREALARAMTYHETISYPDHTFVAVIDKRQRYNGSPNMHGLYGFTFSPRGRALAKAVTLAALARGAHHHPSFWARMVENYVHSRPGPTPRYTPWRGQRTLEDHTCFVREKGWQHNFSVNPVVVDPASPFRLDYQSLYSVWHESVGLIVSGAQDKNRPHHNTFHAKGGKGLGVLHGGRIGDRREPKYLEAFYSSGVTGRIEMSLRRADTLELTAKALGRARRGGVLFNLPLRVGPGATVKVGRTSHKLTRKPLALPVRGGAEVSLFDGRVGITSQAGGRLHFPCMPFNPYSKGNRSRLAQAFLRFEVPVPTAQAAAKVRIKLHP